MLSNILELRCVPNMDGYINRFTVFDNIPLIKTHSFLNPDVGGIKIFPYLLSVSTKSLFRQNFCGLERLTSQY